MLKELFKGSVIYGIAPFVPKILTVLLLPILTKYLTSTDYGVIGTITSITFAVQALQDLGLRPLLANHFYKCKYQYKVIWREIYGFLSLWMIVYAVIQATLLYFFIPEEAESNKWLIIILSNFSTVFFGPTAMIGQTYYQLNIKPAPVAIRIVIAGVTTILANYICVVYFRHGYLGAYVGSFAGTFVTNISYWYAVNKKIGLSPIYNFKHRTIIRLLKVGIPTIPHYYTAYLLNSSNVVAMNYYGRPKSEIGTLTMAQSISGMFETVINAVNQVFTPMTYKNIKDNKPEDMRKLLFAYIIMTYSLTFLYSLWSREAYSLLISNEEIAATYKYSIILVMALNYRPLYVYCCSYFFYNEKTIPLLGITFCSGAISCLVYFTMIPHWGIYAALIGFYIGCLYYGYSGYMYSVYKKHTIYKLKWHICLGVQLILTTIAWKCVDMSIQTKLLVSVVYLSNAGIFFFKYVRYNTKVSFVEKQTLP